jgi:secondary thiamine-phosphate synthase enzyme
VEIVRFIGLAVFISRGRFVKGFPPALDSAKRDDWLVGDRVRTRMSARRAQRKTISMKRLTLEVFTEGNSDVQNLSPQVAKHLRQIGGDGVLHLFVVGSTASITTLEYEPGLVKHDLAALMQKLIPDDATYQHEQTWNDDNGHSHLRSAFLGPGVTIPFADGKLMTGEYQQVVLVDFDTRPRKRIVIATVLN